MKGFLFCVPSGKGPNTWIGAMRVLGLSPTARKLFSNRPPTFAGRLTSASQKAYYIHRTVRPRPVSLRIVALFATVALLLPEATFARVHYFCRMMDRVSESGCCCSHEDSSKVVGPEARRPDCCAR